MEIKYGATGREIIVQHLQFTSIIGRSWISPASFIIYSDLEPLNEHIFNILSQKDTKVVKPTVLGKWLQLEYHPEMYENFKPTSNRVGDVKMLNRKMIINQQYFPVKTSSQRFDVNFLDFSSKKRIATISMLVVNTNLTTRHSIPYSEPWRNYFTPENCAPKVYYNKEPPENQKYTIPEATFTQIRAKYPIPNDVVTFTLPSKVTAKQVDLNGNVHANEYSNICLDCLGAAFVQSIFGNLGSIFDYKLRRLSFLWFSELVVLQEIEIVCWHDNENAFIFKFHIMSHNDVVCQVELEFFPDSKLKLKL